MVIVSDDPSKEEGRLKGKHPPPPPPRDNVEAEFVRSPLFPPLHNIPEKREYPGGL
jgi:hypothetical protein